MKTPLTVKQLIEKLQQMNPDTIVLTRSYEDGYDPAIEIEEHDVITWKDSEWYYGDYRDAEPDDEESFKAILIR